MSHQNTSLKRGHMDDPMKDFFWSEHYPKGGDPTKHQRKVLMEKLFPEKLKYKIECLCPKTGRKIEASLQGPGIGLKLTADDKRNYCAVSIDYGGSLTKKHKLSFILSMDADVVIYSTVNWSFTDDGGLTTGSSGHGNRRLIPRDGDSEEQEKARKHVTDLLKVFRKKMLDIESPRRS